MLRTNDALTKTKGNYIRDENKVASSRKLFGDTGHGTWVDPFLPSTGQQVFWLPQG